MTDEIKHGDAPATDEDIKEGVAKLATHLEAHPEKVDDKPAAKRRDAYGELAGDKDLQRDHHPESWCSDIPEAPKEVVRCTCGLLREKTLAHGSRTLE